MKPVKKTKALLKYINQIKAHYETHWNNQTYEELNYTDVVLASWYESYKTNVLHKNDNGVYLLTTNWKKKKIGYSNNSWALNAKQRRIINPEVRA